MTQLMKILGGLLLAILMTACGGGGGSPGATTIGGGSTTTTTGTVTAAISLDLVTSAGTTTTTVGSLSPVFARATVRDAAGVTIAGEVVTFTGDALVRFLPASGTALTGLNGTALIQVLPASSDSAGAGTLKASATITGSTVSQVTSFQVPQGVSNVATSRVANFVLLLDKSTLPNSGTATAKLTVVAVDSTNNVVSGAAVNVATDANTVFIPGSTATDAQGQYTGQIGPGGDKADRTVVATVTINGIVKQTSLQVAGSQVEITVAPTIPSPSQTGTVTARVTDSSSLPIANTAVTFSGDIPGLANRQITTDSNGKAIVNFAAPATAGSYLLAASASGITSQISVQVGSSAVIPVAVIPGGAQPGLSAIPNVLAPNAAGSTTNQGQLRFLFLDAQNQPIPNVRVRFGIISSGLGSFDSTISTEGSTVYTNAAGVATAAFIPGSTGSPTDGVQVRACYQATDFTSAAQCVSSVDVHLTVAAQALAVSIGNDNVIAPGAGGTYIKKFVVTVADAAGRAVANAPVDISLDITHYGKGLFDQGVTFPLSVGAANTYVPADISITPAAFGARVSCINEDFNRNGFVDANENVNSSFDSFGQPTLEPRRSDIILSYVDPAVRTTNASGVLLIQVEYSQRFATWLTYRIRAITNVAGSQGTVERAFVTTFAENDSANGSFHTPPYGVSSCNSPN
jgi:hypothetical protein